MKYALIYQMLQMIYSAMLRGLVVKAVSDPSAEWDDVLLNMLDGLFGHEGGK